MNLSDLGVKEVVLALGANDLHDVITSLEENYEYCITVPNDNILSQSGGDYVSYKFLGMYIHLVYKS